MLHTYYTPFLCTETIDYPKILRKVANEAGANRWKTLSNNLGVDGITCDTFKASNLGNIQDAMADVLDHWWENTCENSVKKPTWSVLITAMFEFNMTAE